jgi:hypothetical protein
MAPSTLLARSPVISRRTVIGAAWSAPVVLAAVAAPLAAASGGGQPDASFLWSDSSAYFGGTSELQLVLPAGSAGIGSTGTITFTSADGGSIPRSVSVTGQADWVYTRDTTDNVGILTSTASGVSGGLTLLSVVWSNSAQPGTILATWTNSGEQGSLGDSIALDAAPWPTVEWQTNPVVFGAATTLRVIVPRNSAGLGQPTYLISGQYRPGTPSPAFPPGTQVSLPAGWIETVLSETDPFTGVVTTTPVFELEALVAGTYDFVYTIGAGTTPVSPSVILAIYNTSGLVEVPLDIVAA